MRFTLSACLYCAVALALARHASGLSASVCDQIEAEWQTETPHLTGNFPYYTLLVSCTGNLSLEGVGVDACVNAGKNCGSAAADAFCNYLGLDASAYDNMFTQVVPASAPVRSMTGEWCVRNGSYTNLTDTPGQNITDLNLFPGPFCTRLDSVLCYRSRNSSLLLYQAEQAKQSNLSIPALAPGPLPSIAAVLAGNIQNATPSGTVPSAAVASPAPANTSSNTSHSAILSPGSTFMTVTAQAG